MRWEIHESPMSPAHCLGQHRTPAAGFDLQPNLRQRASDRLLQGLSVPELVGEIYETAPLVVRKLLLEELMRALGLLSLYGIAGGIFADIRFHGGWQELNVRIEDIKAVSSAQVIALADHTQQVNFEAIDGLAQVLLASPNLAGSVAAGVLIGMLLQRAMRWRKLKNSVIAQETDDA